MSFVHLHTHSHYSILTWLPKPSDYITRALELWMPWVALTDYWNIHGCHEFYKSAKAREINPILGCEFHVLWKWLDSTDPNNIAHNLVILAKNYNGYKNIMEMSSIWHLSGQRYWLPCIDMEVIKQHSKNLICLSGPIEWEISYYILSWKTDEKIFERIQLYQSIFWKENYYLELGYHEDVPKQELVTDRFIELHKKFNIPVVATNNTFYISKKDKKIQDIIMCLNTWDEVSNPDRKTLINGDYSFLEEFEIEALFWNIPSALENTEKINEQIHIEIETWVLRMPVYVLPEDHQNIFDDAQEKKEQQKTKEKLQSLNTDEWYLRYLCFEWLNKRFKFGLDNETILEFIKKLDGPKLKQELQWTLPEELQELWKAFFTDKKIELLKNFNQEQTEIIERLEYELIVVHEMGFDAYFLIVADYIIWAKNQNIPVGPGRWSAAWALLAYLTEITNINPLQYWLLFERFLNPARVSMPDIDVDFSDKERDKVLEYVRQKYWNEYVAQICTFWTFAARAAVKDVWRIQGITFAKMNELAKLIPEKPGTKLKDALETSIEFKQAYDENATYREIINNALKIEWNVRQIWVHACAVIIAPEKLTTFTALQHPPKDSNAIVTQYSANPLEDLWLLKMDFLWLRNLSIIKRAIAIITRVKKVEIDIDNINFEDKKVFKIFSDWDTTWVFQFESPWMRKYLKDLEPNCFEDIIVMVSLYRPWPLEWIPVYIKRKKWIEKVKYPHPSLNDILWPTQWIAVYQEQIMQLVQAFAWFSLWEADILRRAIWKKKVKLLMEQKEKFLEATKKLWHKEKLALHIFEKVIEPFAGYGFNKSHAACYSMIAYQTAYLKAYYPTEFLTAILTADAETLERVNLEVAEAKSKNINVLPPWINDSLKRFTYINDKTIRFWLKAIKWLWDGPIDHIIEERKNAQFVSLEDFINRMPREVINKKSLEALIQSWSMDNFWKRGTLLANIEEIIRFAKAKETQKTSSQLGLFEEWWDFDDWLNFEEWKELTLEEKLVWEKEVLWIMVSWHPLDWLKKYINKRSNNTSFLKKSFSQLQETKKKTTVSVDVVWLMTLILKKNTKSGKILVIIQCESFDFDFEVLLFEKEYDAYKDKLRENAIIVVNWNIRVWPEMRYKTITAKSIKVASITQVHQQAKEMWLFDKSKINKYKNQLALEDPENQELKEDPNTPPNWDDSTEENNNDQDEKENNKWTDFPVAYTVEDVTNNVLWEDYELKKKKETKYIITIPQTAQKQDLLDLKTFLQKQEDWKIQVFINLKWQEIDTKLTVTSSKIIETWMEKTWEG